MEKNDESNIPYMMYEKIDMCIAASELSCEELGKIFGCRRNTLYAYKNGDTAPNATILMRMCEYFNVSADWMLGLKETHKLHENRKSVLDI